jgi:phosphopantetheinyl transferase (holo-ACP synthase)
MPAGNDIVAWKHPRCINKSQHTRFLEKTCIPAEISNIQTAENPDLLLWTMWALKEATYKLSCFMGNRNGFIARRFETEFISGEIKISGNNPIPLCNMGLPVEQAVSNWKIQLGNEIFSGVVLATENYIHALATPEAQQLTQVHWGISKNTMKQTDNDTEAVRVFTLEQLNIQLNNQFVSIEKDKDGIPFLKTTGNNSPYISISHDQGFLAFAFLDGS